MEQQNPLRGRSGCASAALLLAALVLAYGIYLYSIGFLAADSCLDSGGSYHYDVGECSFSENYRGEVPGLPWPF